MRKKGLKARGVKLLQERVGEDKDIAWYDVECMLEELEATMDNLAENDRCREDYTIAEKPLAGREGKEEKGSCCTEERNRFQYFLDTTQELAEKSSYTDICQLAAETIYTYFDRRVIVAIVDYDLPNNRWKMVSHKGVDKVVKLLGFPIENMTGSIESKYLEELKKGRLTCVGEDIPGLTGGAISSGVGKILARMLGITNMHSILFLRSGGVFGNVTIIQRKDSPPMDRLFVEAFVSQVGLFVEKLQSRNQLKVALKRAEESDKLKTAFLSNISHEIRTPMNGIVGFVDLLRMPEITKEEQAEYLDIIEKSSRRLQSLIESLVEVSLLQTEQVTPSGKLFDAHQLMDQLGEEFSLQAEEKKLELKMDKELKQPSFMIKSDRLLLKKILGTLLDNALKYTTEGFVKTGYALEDKTTRFYVYDTGPGIEDRNRTKIFDYFWQVEGFSNQAPEGVGLGLPIANAYVRMLGGELKVETNSHGGSTFFFSIPLKDW